ncbi:radical SAM protein [Anaerocolumna jejuensis]|uniref:radical SAM protein n=1 Tax=Anaerocolumna jejuensis TaxID=259063 RepID=UPI003F7BCCE9
MELSKDLLVIKNEEKTLTYNYFMHRACIIDTPLFDKIEQNKLIIEEFVKNEKEKNIDFLFNNGVIIQDREQYKKLKHSNIIVKKKRTVDLNIVYLHITQRCNLRCSYCYNSDNLNRPDGITIDECKEIANKLKNCGVKKIIITGGEPFIRMDLLEICKIFKEHGFSLEILTNGSLINRNIEVLEFIDKAVISIDTFDGAKNLRIGLDLDKFREIIKMVAHKYSDKIILRSVITKKDEESWKTIKEFANELNCSFIQSVFSPNNISEISLIPSIDCAQEIGVELTQLSGVICGACFKEIAIDSNGDIYPCQSLIKSDFLISNIFTNNWFDELNESKITKYFKERFICNVEGCSKCNYKYICGGGCPAISYNLYGDLNRNAEPMCKFHIKESNEKLEKVLEYYGR